MGYRKEISDGVFAVYNGRYIQAGESIIINPTHDMLLSNGYEPYDEPAAPRNAPEAGEVLAAVKALFADTAAALTDAEALDVAAIFPTWASMDGRPVNVGERYWYDGNLYRVVQAHTVQQLWNPKDSPALFVVVTNEVSGADGSIGSPYEWVSGMVAELGIYYTYAGVLYRCVRDSGTPLYYEPSALIGNYFEEVQV